MAEAVGAGDLLPELHGSGVVLRELAPGHAEGLRAIRRERAVADFWGPLEDDFPLADEPTARRYAILVGDELAGMIQFSEENEPDYRHAEVDVFVSPAERGRGHGTEAMRTLLAYLTGERGHHRVILGTATHNEAALRSYEKAGFRRVGVTRRSGRDYRTGEFGDEWFMEYVVPATAATAATPATPRARVTSALIAGDTASLADVLAPDVHFHSPAADYVGADDVLHLLDFIAKVLADLQPGEELLGPSGTGTRFDARVGDHRVDGLLHEMRGCAGRVAELTLLLRPHAGVREAMRRMGELLAAAPLPSER